MSGAGDGQGGAPASTGVALSSPPTRVLLSLFTFTTHCARPHKSSRVVLKAPEIAATHVTAPSVLMRPELKKKILLFRDGKLQRYREIWLQEGSAFILIGETCASSVRFRQGNVTLFSHLCTDTKISAAWDQLTGS